MHNISFVVMRFLPVFYPVGKKRYIMAYLIIEASLISKNYIFLKPYIWRTKCISKNRMIRLIRSLHSRKYAYLQNSKIKDFACFSRAFHILGMA